MKIGILSSGGDCPGINATIRGVGKTAIMHYGMEVVGIHSGFVGLLNKDIQSFDERSLSGILNLGGTILGTSREKPFRKLLASGESEKPQVIIQNYEELGLDCLVCIGGNGTQKTAGMLSALGLNIIGVPKTIDNDTWGTDYTFGFQSAVDIATNYLNEIETTAKSHSRVFVVEIMGHKVGHICLQAGIAAGVDAILLPEIPYDIKVVAKKIKENQKTGKEYTIIACAEGAISEEDSLLSKKKYKAKVASRQGRSVAYEIAEQLQELIPNEIRVALAGHIQRGGNPCSYDRFMATRFGVYGANLLLNKDFGKLVVFDKNEIKAIPLSETAGKLKFVDPECEVVSSAKKMGITFGE